MRQYNHYFKWLKFDWDLAQNVRFKWGSIIRLFMLLSSWERKELEELGIEERFIKAYKKELNHAS